MFAQAYGSNHPGEGREISCLCVLDKVLPWYHILSPVGTITNMVDRIISRKDVPPLVRHRCIILPTYSPSIHTVSQSREVKTGIDTRIIVEENCSTRLRVTPPSIRTTS